MIRNNEIPHLSSEEVDSTLPVYRFKAKVDNEYSFLSNFYPHVKNFNENSPRPHHTDYLFEAHGRKFNSVEQYYQYNKFLHIDAWYTINRILTAPTAEEVKIRSGKGVYVDYMYDQRKTEGRTTTKARLKEHFDKEKRYFMEQSLHYMREGLHLKFVLNPQLRAALLATGMHPLSS